MQKFGSSRINPGAVFLLIFTVDFLLCIAPAEGSNPAGQSLTPLTKKNTIKIYCGNTMKPGSWVYPNRSRNVSVLCLPWTKS